MSILSSAKCSEGRSKEKHNKLFVESNYQERNLYIYILIRHVSLQGQIYLHDKYRIQETLCVNENMFGSLFRF